MSILAMKQALDDICGAKLCEVNSMSSRAEMIRLMDKAITALRQAIAEAEKREWVGLTQKEFLQATQIAARGNCCLAITYAQQTLKEKNCATAPVSE